MIAVLGGGISGLCAAYYACERCLGHLVLLEASDRLGGWIRSVKLPNGTIMEMGPRSIRPRGIQGKNTLDLVDSLDLTDKLLPVSSSHSAAKNRMIYVNKKLHLLPNSLSGLFRTLEPFDGPLIKIFWKDLTSPKIANVDENMYSFVERRLGKDIAENLISPMICGICAGDAKKISVNMIMSSMFEAEQKYGSIAKGLLIERIKKFFTKKEKNVKKQITGWEIMNDNDSRSAKRAEMEKWALWGLKDGFEQLPKRLAETLQHRNTEIQLNEKCEKITFYNDRIELLSNKKRRICSHIISSLPAKSLAPLLEHQHPQLAAELSDIPCVTVAVVNLEFPGKCVPSDGFGFLVPPKEENPILGVIFDSCIFPNDTSTVLTVMMGGAWFQKYFGSAPDKEYLLKVAVEQVTKILGINVAPTSKNVAILKDCIAQHIVGHNERIKRIQNYISAHRLPLALCGSSYQGIGVNDVILSAKQAVYDIDEQTVFTVPLTIHSTSEIK